MVCLGVITVVRRLPNTKQVFSLQISARDGAGQESQSTASVTISLVDTNSQTTPVFSETLYHFQVAEDVGVRSYVGTVEAAARGQYRKLHVHMCRCIPSSTCVLQQQL